MPLICLQISITHSKCLQQWFSDFAWAEERGSSFLHTKSFIVRYRKHLVEARRGHCRPHMPSSSTSHHGVHPHTPTHTHIYPQSDCSGTSVGLLRIQGEQLEMLGVQSQSQTHIPADRASGHLFYLVSLISHHSYLELNTCLPLISLCLPNVTNNSVPLSFSSWCLLKLQASTQSHQVCWFSWICFNDPIQGKRCCQKSYIHCVPRAPHPPHLHHTHCPPFSHWLSYLQLPKAGTKCSSSLSPGCLSPHLPCWTDLLNVDWNEVREG